MADEKAGGADAAESFSEEDLSHVKGDAGGDEAQDGAGAEGADKGQAGAADGDKGAGDGKQPDGKAVGEKPAQAKPGKTIAAGADAEAEDKAKEEAKPAKANPFALTEEMRRQIAEHYAAGDKKALDRELKRLERVGGDMKSLWGLYRDLDNRLNGGGLIKVPGKDAKPEEIAAYHKAIGVPEKPEDYLKELKLDNGAVVGDADKPLISTFADAMHKAGAPPTAVHAALNVYYKMQEDNAAQLDEADTTFRIESEEDLKDQWGPSFKRRINAMTSVFATAPGGADAKNPDSLYAQIVSARTPDGKILGNHPDFLRWLDYVRGEINPAASIVEDGAQNGVSMEAEIEKIEGIMRTNRREYNQKHEKRYLELLAAREKIQARQRA